MTLRGILAGAGVAAFMVVPAVGSSCAELSALTIPNVKIASATAVSAGAFSPTGTATTMTLPAFCRVIAVATPTSDSLINFEVWIPPADAWNGKFQGVGNAAWSGTIAYAAMANALRRGYATGSTDAGHTGDDLKFANGHPEKIADWAYRAVHVMTDAAKLIVRASQGRLPQYSYFTGCSTAGAQALTEAQRFPGDYDGMMAADPGNERINRVASYLWSWAAVHKDPESMIPAAKLPLLAKAAVEACDGLDGVKDGVIDAPRRCHFDPGVLLCRGADDGTCLTAPQVKAARKIYRAPETHALVNKFSLVSRRAVNASAMPRTPAGAATSSNPAKHPGSTSGDISCSMIPTGIGARSTGTTISNTRIRRWRLWTPWTGTWGRSRNGAAKL